MALIRRRPSKPPSIPFWDRRLRPGREGRGTWKGRAILPLWAARQPDRAVTLSSACAPRHPALWLGSSGCPGPTWSPPTVPPAEAHGVVTFYHLFSLAAPWPSPTCVTTSPVGSRGGSVCAASWSIYSGRRARACGNEARASVGAKSAPAALVLKAGESPSAISLAPTTSADIVAARASEEMATHDDFKSLRQSIPQFGDPKLRLLGRIGQIDPESLEAYRASGGYAGLARAIEFGPEGVIREVSASKLMGRGGAAFPTGRKWEAVAKARARPRYVVCNADESEPGTFKDRVLMEGDSFAVLEGDDDRGLRDGERFGVSLRAWGVSPGDPPDEDRDRRGSCRGLCLASNVYEFGLPFDFVASQRRRRLHLRRGDGPLQLDRREAWRTTEQAPISGSSRTFRQADGRQ